MQSVEKNVEPRKKDFDIAVRLPRCCHIWSAPKYRFHAFCDISGLASHRTFSAMPQFSETVSENQKSQRTHAEGRSKPAPLASALLNWIPFEYNEPGISQ